MILTVFRLRLTDDPDALREYHEMAPRMSEIARATPGFISVKRFLADDGERVTIVEFENEASHDAFVNHPEHLEAMKLGRTRAFLEYDIKVCDVRRARAKPPASRR